MSWMKSRVRPPLARRTVRTSSARPGTKRSCADAEQRPARDVADAGGLDDEHAGLAAAKRAYQARTSGVTRPSSVARQGTIAGTQVRSARSSRPTRSGLNQSERAASSAVGGRVAGIGV